MHLIPLLWLYEGRRRLFAALIALGLLTAALEIGALIALYNVLMVAFGSPSGGRMARALSAIAGRLPGDLFTSSLALYVLVDTAHFAAGYTHRLLAHSSALRIRDALHRRFFDAYASADYQFFLDRSAGDLRHWILLAPVQLGELAAALPLLLTHGATVVGVAVLIAWVSPAVAGAVLVTVLILAGGHWLLTRRRTQALGAEKLRLREAQSLLVNEALAGIRHFKVYGCIDRWVTAFEGVCGEYARMMRGIFAASALPPRAMAVGSVTVFASTAVLIHLRWPDAFAAYASVLTMSYVAAQRLMPAVAGAALARTRLTENFPAAEHARQELRGVPFTIRSGRLPVPPLGEGIRFVKVVLSYPGRRDVLREVSFLCETGRTTAIVGPSGAGKSSLLNVLVRLFDPTAGDIVIGGVSLRELDVMAWRARIGVVAQESFLLYGTIAENIAFGRERSRAAIEGAARIAGLDEFTATLPLGFDTVVGERGLQLSGGQRQRVGIARAVLDDPEILALDEATSSLDAPTEAAVQSAIVAASRGRTVIVVAHRITTIARADLIVVLDRGRVVEQGAHAELTRRGGLYSDLYYGSVAGRGGAAAAVAR